MPRIIAYPWCNPTTATSSLSTTAKLTIERSAIDHVVSTFPGTTEMHGLDQLAWYNTNNAYISTASYSTTTRRVTLADATGFAPTFDDNLAIWYGFTQPLPKVYSTKSWTGWSEPACVQELLNADISAPRDWAQTDMQEFANGRARSVVWGNHLVYRVDCTTKNTWTTPFTKGFVTTGKVRIDQDGVGALTGANLSGYLDGFVVASTDLVEDGDIGEIVGFTLWISTARS